MEKIYFQPKGIRPQYCEAGMIHESDPEHIWYLDEPCKILISEVKIINKMKTHRLKTVQPYFERCWQCSKTFEVRNNDRDFQKGDTVYLQEYDAETNTYSGKELRCTILYVLHEFPALEKGYVVFSFCVDQFIEGIGTGAVR